MSSSNSPCAACKCLRRKCTQECVFAPYFPPDNPHKFTNVHKVFGASNVSKLLNDLSPNQREDAVNSLAYEAEQRLRDPVFGCVGLISLLQSRLRQVQHDLEVAKKELAAYIGPSAMLPVINHHAGLAQPGFGPGPYHQVVIPYSAPQQTMMGPAQHQHQILEAHIAAAREQEMIRSFEQQNRESELLRFNNNGGFGDLGGGNNVVTVASGFSEMTMQPPSLALGVSGYEQAINYEDQIQQQEHEIQLQLQQSQELLIQQQHSVVTNQSQQVTMAHHQQQQIIGRAKSEEGKSNIGPSC